MVSQLMRSSRGLLVLGAVLAIAAFAVVVYVLNQKSPAKTATPVVSVTATVGTVVPTATATPPVKFVQAIKAVPAGKLLTSDSEVRYYFRDVTPASGVQFTSDTLNGGITALETNVISGTNFLGSIQITNAITKNTLLHTGDFKLLPYSPIGSFAYQIAAGHVALSISPILPVSADGGAIMPGDTVDVLLTERQHAFDAITSNPPTDTSGPLETQQIISSVRVVATAPATNTYTLELPLQDALLMKYVRDSNEGTVDLVLVSSADVRTQAAQPLTYPVVPESFLTPVAQVQGTPGTTPQPTAVVGVTNPFRPLLPTPHP